MYICYKRMPRISYRIQAGHPKMASHTGEAENLELVGCLSSTNPALLDKGFLAPSWPSVHIGWLKACSDDNKG